MVESESGFWTCHTCKFKTNDWNELTRHGKNIGHEINPPQFKKKQRLKTPECPPDVIDIGNEMVIVITVKKIKNEDGDEKEFPSKWVEYDNGGAILFQTIKNGIQKTVVYKGKLVVNSKIKFKHADSDDIRWSVNFKGNDFVGGIEEITNFLIQHGNVFIGKDDMKKIMAHIITRLQEKTPELCVRPAVGLYYDFKEKVLELANDDKTVYPELDSQKTVFRSYELERQGLDATKKKDVVQASVDLITSMPEVNKQPALITRGYACIAPIAYEIKKTAIGVFPYLYLYGQKGSSKTQLALYSVVKCFGEGNVLNSDSVDSQFRLGMEFAATKNPGMIDEAKEIFEKHQSIFKSAATGDLATKRGNKDKTMSNYPAFRSFVLTSNVMPINNEEDAQGAITDRVIIIECARGADFNKEKYQSAIRVLNEQGMLFGDEIIEELSAIFKERGLAYFTEEINRISGAIQEVSDIPLRRAHCLAILVLGVRIYYRILRRFGLPEPIEYANENMMIDMLAGNLTAKTLIDERQFATDFMEWAIGMLRSPNNLVSGLFYAADDRQFIITKNALKAYRRHFQIKNMAVCDLQALVMEFRKIGIRTEVKSVRDRDTQVKWGVSVPLTHEETQTTSKLEKNSLQ